MLQETIIRRHFLNKFMANWIKFNWPVPSGNAESLRLWRAGRWLAGCRGLDQIKPVRAVCLYAYVIELLLSAYLPSLGLSWKKSMELATHDASCYTEAQFKTNVNHTWMTLGTCLPFPISFHSTYKSSATDSLGLNDQIIMGVLIGVCMITILMYTWRWLSWQENRWLNRISRATSVLALH